MNEILTIDPIPNRQTLLNLKINPHLQEGVSIVYIYFLSNKMIEYPLENSSILYIGEAYRRTTATRNRFSQHISSEIRGGGDNGFNLTLSQYFFSGEPIGLKIFSSDELDRKDDETDLMYSHIDLFGSPQIGQRNIIDLAHKLNFNKTS